MGGDYYDRDVYSAPINSTVSYSNTSANVVGVKNTLDATLDPRNYDENLMVCKREDPIVFALDVTGSMGDWTKIIYDKMPMFYGQIMQQKYLNDPAISICAVGDCTSDEAPLQVSNFVQSNDIDTELAKLYLEGGGGGGYTESYDLAAYFYLKRVNIDCYEHPFFFVTGDEAFYEKIKTKHINKFLGVFEKSDVDSKEIWAQLMKKYNVFLIKKPYDSPNEEKVRKLWIDAIGEERVLDIQNAKACIDVILGAIAVTTGVRDLKTYLVDMKNRGQTNNRIDEVYYSLEKYALKVQIGKIVPVRRNLEPNDKLLNDVIKDNSIDFRSIIEEADKVKLDGLSDEKLKYIEALKNMKSTFNDTIPREFICPITEEIFFDPVMTSDGQTYERAAIDTWLKNHATSPMTNLTLSNKTLIPNFVLKKLINSFYEMNKNNL